MSQGQRRSPVFILNEDSERTKGRDAQSTNINAGKAVAESVRTTLGPQGMDKMLVDSTGEVVITNDGVTILQEMDIDHPAAQLIVEVAESQEETTGDGTTTASVLAGQLLAKSEELVDQDIHPRTIVDGYTEAARIAQAEIDDIALDDDLDDETLAKVASSSMTGKGTGDFDAAELADLVVDAARRVRSGGKVHRDDIHITAEMGASSRATDIVNGAVTDEKPAREGMPRSVEDVTVLLLNSELEKRETTVDVEYDVGGSDQIDQALEAEREEFRSYAEKLDEAGVDVLISTEDVADPILDYLEDYGILTIDNVDSYSEHVGKQVAKATGATPVGSVEDIDPDHLGHAESVHVETYGDESYTLVDGGDDSGIVTVFVRGGTAHVTDELERAIGDAVDVVSTALDEGGVVPGAGVTEIKIASRLRDEAAGVSGRKQLAVEAFADAVEVLPRTLAENTGMDQIDALVDMRAANEDDGCAGIIARGETGELDDPLEHGILDPTQVKRKAVENAAESASTILRIDDIISADQS
ncbi:MAG: thermosome subunit alpha [Halobacteriaceae archaeon]